MVAGATREPRPASAEKPVGHDDPVFPATLVALGADHRFKVFDVKRKPWSNAEPIRAIVEEAFESAGLPYFNPHGFRTTLAVLAERLCRTPEEY